MVRVAIRMGLVAIACLMSGCGGGGSTPPTGKVSGVVKYNGAALPNVVVTFMPADGRPATGQTDADGKYTLSTFGEGDGAVLGEHRVYLTSASSDEPMPETPDAAAAAPKLPFPERYSNAETSQLTKKVESGTNDIPIEITD